MRRVLRRFCTAVDIYYVVVRAISLNVGTRATKQRRYHYVWAEIQLCLIFCAHLVMKVPHADARKVCSNLRRHVPEVSTKLPRHQPISSRMQIDAKLEGRSELRQLVVLTRHRLVDYVNVRSNSLQRLLCTLTWKRSTYQPATTKKCNFCFIGKHFEWCTSLLYLSFRKPYFL